MSIRGHVGRASVVPEELSGANITQDTARLALLGLDPHFALRCLTTAGVQQYMARRTKGAAVKGINLGDLKKMPLPVPPLEEQKKFSHLMSQLESQKARASLHLSFLDTLFASLQSRAFAGKL